MQGRGSSVSELTAEVFLPPVQRELTLSTAISFAFVPEDSTHALRLDPLVPRLSEQAHQIGGLGFTEADVAGGLLTPFQILPGPLRI